MAVAGLQNVSPFRPSLFGDDRAGPATRASSVLQMWREIEGDHVMMSPSPRFRPQMNGSDSESLRSDGEDNHSIISEQSSDLGETERERVRQIFREWMNGSNRAGPQRAEMNTRRADGGAGVGPVRGPIRKLCGRQTLVDLLLRAQCERKEEIQCLLEQRRVSDFAHRNRIQALLRGRFLRNERVIPDKKPPSVAVTELGLLRQRQTVSYLREGFLSKLDNCASTSVHNLESESSSINENDDESNSTSIERDENNQILTTSADVNSNQQNLVTEVEYSAQESTGNEQQVRLNNTGDVQEVPIEFSDNETIEQMNAIITVNESPVENDDIDISHEDYENEEFEEPEIEIDEDSEWQRVTGNWVETSDNQWVLETFGNDTVERDHMHESRQDSWPSHDFEEAIDSWIHMPSREIDASARRVDTFYFLDDDDDDNAHSIELRELFSRRRVSSLLGSSFRESLNRVLQSHAERLNHASTDWEMDNVEQDEDPINGDHQMLSLSNGDEINRFASWDEEFQETHSPHSNLNHQFGTEWEVINEMRNDMAMLQHRLNNMQSMLEACMDMQLELQRSVRQEVSAALNRTTLTTNSNALKGDTLHDESRWDHVKKGICCVCSDSKIDSLLYRCGHMCTCSNCAEKLVKDNGKCPMCRAPIVEAVRAYFTH